MSWLAKLLYSPCVDCGRHAKSSVWDRERCQSCFHKIVARDIRAQEERERAERVSELADAIVLASQRTNRPPAELIEAVARIADSYRLSSGPYRGPSFTFFPPRLTGSV